MPQHNEEQTRFVLEQRARILAQAKTSLPQIDLSGNEYLIFKILNDAYALPVQVVRRVVTHNYWEPVPGMLPPFMGVTNLAGNILSLVSSAHLMGLKVAAEQFMQVIVIGEDRDEFGLLVSAVSDTKRIGANDIVARTEVQVDNGLSKLVVGYSKDGLAVLDGQRLLSDERISGK